MATYPIKRLRRLRYNPIVRDMIRETSLSKNDLIYPLFVVPGEKVKNEVKSMPGVYQMSVDVLVEECKDLVKRHACEPVFEKQFVRLGRQYIEP